MGGRYCVNARYYIDSAEDRDYWGAIVNAALNLRVRWSDISLGNTAVLRSGVIAMDNVSMADVGLPPHTRLFFSLQSKYST